MEFYPLHQETEQVFNEIRRRIFRLQNGRGLDSMHRMGVQTNGQIGASYVSLKTLAQQYSPDLELALRLWGTRQREEQIVACFLLPILSMNKEKITQLLSACFNFEIAEYAGTLVLAQREDLPQMAREYFTSNNPYLQTAALTAIAREGITRKEKSIFPSTYLDELAQKNWATPYVTRVFERVQLNMNVQKD